MRTKKMYFVEGYEGEDTWMVMGYTRYTDAHVHAQSARFFTRSLPLGGGMVKNSPFDPYNFVSFSTFYRVRTLMYRELPDFPYVKDT